MITGKRFAAIDIGSNAVRLLLSAVFQTDSGPYFRKISLIRMPIRLGKDAFLHGRISKDNADRLISVIRGYKSLITAYRPLDVRACATSAMRESSNGKTLKREILDQTGIDIEIIDGKKEARIIFANNPWVHLEGDMAWLFVDVGGGSTEITIFSNRGTISRSFGIGTIRLLENLVPKAPWRAMKAWVRDQTSGFSNIGAIGSGGNINTIIKLAPCANNQSITLKKLKQVSNHLSFYSYVDRVTQLGLKPDRADVIMPALQIYKSVMKWGGIRTLRVPQIGLADGLVRLMYQRSLRRPASNDQTSSQPRA
jgi:exopolyphosphatase / guanosine-5'-triphosphate,3'-diphosphate pyrophosphatase